MKTDQIIGGLASDISSEIQPDICVELKNRFVKRGHWIKFIRDPKLFETNLVSIHEIHLAKTIAVLNYLKALSVKKRVGTNILYTAALEVFGINSTIKLADQAKILGNLHDFQNTIFTFNNSHTQDQTSYL